MSIKRLGHNECRHVVGTANQTGNGIWRQEEWVSMGGDGMARLAIALEEGHG